MFDIGLQELVVIFLIALLVFGPEKLPGVGKTLGKWMFELRKGIDSARDQMTREMMDIEKKERDESPQQHMSDTNSDNLRQNKDDRNDES